MIASGVMPAPSLRSTISTGTRVPLMTGLPPMISGLISIRSCVTAISIGCAGDTAHASMCV